MTARDRPQAIRIQGLRYETGGATLLDSVNLCVGRGQFVGLVGPNGAGKTTLLRCLAGILRSRQGMVLLNGADLRALAGREVATKMALVPQLAPDTQGFSAKEIVLMGRYPHLGRFQVEGREDERIACETMQLTGTVQLADRELDTLSGGERQRVFISRALAQQPCILLLDEPTANLDVLHQLRLLDLVRGLVDDGLTAIAAIHDLNMAARHCDQLVLLGKGRVLAEGRPADVLTPETVAAAFGVKAAVYQDPVTGAPALSLIGPADESQLAGAGCAGSHTQQGEQV